MKLKLLTIAAILLLSGIAEGQTKLTGNTFRIDKNEIGESSTVSAMEWMEGNWTGNALGGSVREVWTKTDGGVMMGMFLLVQDKKPVFYEFLTFTIEDGGLILKLKHFDPKLIGWEEKGKTVDFRFIKRVGNRFYFHGLTFENVDKNSLNIYLALRNKEQIYHEEVFRLTRSDQ
ncbi:MAG: hypothetical protein KDB79_05000 [Acidobacteria bacterium]|nr:hypothetical protein [Acidobacteriota bacterium]